MTDQFSDMYESRLECGCKYVKSQSFCDHASETFFLKGQAASVLSNLQRGAAGTVPFLEIHLHV